MLVIENLHVKAGDKPILNGINLRVNAGEVHAIMGPNGSGKSTLLQVLAGHSGLTITKGHIDYQKQDLSALSVSERACQGLFLGFQYPLEISGVNNMYLLKTALNNQLKQRGQKEVDAMEFIELVKNKMKQLNMDEKFLYRDMNCGFSGGEKKRNEILQMLVLEPTLALLDEIDSGLDVDAMKAVANGINAYHHQDNALLLVTHYQRLLDHITPHYVHVMQNGQIVQTGPAELARQLEQQGYATTTQH